jgi:hypothetical protein
MLHPGFHVALCAAQISTNSSSGAVFQGFLAGKARQCWIYVEATAGSRWC